MNWNQQNIEVYDNSAAELAEYFKGIGARVDDIELALKLAGSETGARVVEMGCGDGRDGEEIVKRVAWYEGVDPSEGLLKIARARLPETSFVKADALGYEYPENLDVVYAFASLLHVNKTDMVPALQKIAGALREGGILYLSLKERDEYIEETKTDKYGERMFYYYNPKVIEELAGNNFVVVHEDHQVHGNTDWFTLALKKVN